MFLILWTILDQSWTISDESGRKSHFWLLRVMPDQLFLKSSMSYGSWDHSDTRKRLGDESSSLDLRAEKCDLTIVFAVESHFFPNQACLKGFSLSLIRNSLLSPGRAVPPSPGNLGAVPPSPGSLFPWEPDALWTWPFWKKCFGHLGSLLQNCFSDFGSMPWAARNAETWTLTIERVVDIPFDIGFDIAFGIDVSFDMIILVLTCIEMTMLMLMLRVRLI